MHNKSSESTINNSKSENKNKYYIGIEDVIKEQTQVENDLNKQNDIIVNMDKTKTDILRIGYDIIINDRLLKYKNNNAKIDEANLISKNLNAINNNDENLNSHDLILPYDDYGVNADDIVAIFEDNLDIDQNFARYIASTLHQDACTFVALTAAKTALNNSTVNADDGIVTSEKRYNITFKKDAENANVVKFTNKFAIESFRSAHFDIDEDRKINAKLIFNYTFDFVFDPETKKTSVQNVKLNFDISNKTKLQITNLNGQLNEDINLQKLHSKFLKNAEIALITTNMLLALCILTVTLLTIALNLSDAGIMKLQMSKETITTLIATSSTILCMLFAGFFASFAICKDQESKIEELEKQINDKVKDCISSLDANQTFEALQHLIQKEICDFYADGKMKHIDKLAKLQSDGQEIDIELYLDPKTIEICKKAEKYGHKLIDEKLTLFNSKVVTKEAIEKSIEYSKHLLEDSFYAKYVDKSQALSDFLSDHYLQRKQEEETDFNLKPSTKLNNVCNQKLSAQSKTIAHAQSKA